VASGSVDTTAVDLRRLPARLHAACVIDANRHREGLCRSGRAVLQIGLLGRLVLGLPVTCPPLLLPFHHRLRWVEAAGSMAGWVLLGRSAVEGEVDNLDAAGPDQAAGDAERDTGREGVVGGVGLVAGEDDGVPLVVGPNEGADQPDGGPVLVGPVSLTTARARVGGGYLVAGVVEQRLQFGTRTEGRSTGPRLVASAATTAGSTER
jgi:hypothetical protein